ncbi:hypothetical protein [Kitasatospora phosalacinea]|uniref:Uncharacterized protein n=1 Tax=Kitasatospora phosalacinea TaxID=2065 RepID=A0ABW6GS72_9ACTN
MVAPDEERAWVCLDRPSALVEVALPDGAVVERCPLPVSAVLSPGPDGLPALAPRTGHRPAVRRRSLPRPPDGGTAPAAGPRPYRQVGPAGFGFPHSWEPDRSHLGGPGVELPDGDLLYAGTVHDGRGLQPGGSFVVRRAPSDGAPRWVFRTDRPATALDVDGDVAHIAYDDGELVTLATVDGTVRRRAPLTLGPIVLHPTALTVPAPGRLLVGTADGRVLDCEYAP